MIDDVAKEKIYQDIIIVNDQDEVIGAENLLVAIERHHLRRSSRIFVCNEQHQVLLQKRSQFVHKPGLLDMSAGGHVDSGETYAEAARRELTEELGITNVPLEPLVTSWRNAESFTTIFKIQVPAVTVFTTDPHEIEQVAWYQADIINSQVASTPEQFSPDFISTWNAWKHLL